MKTLNTLKKLTTILALFAAGPGGLSAQEKPTSAHDKYVPLPSIGWNLRLSDIVLLPTLNDDDLPSFDVASFGRLSLGTVRPLKFQIRDKSGIVSVEFIPRRMSVGGANRDFIFLRMKAQPELEIPFAEIGPINRGEGLSGEDVHRTLSIFAWGVVREMNRERQEHSILLPDSFDTLAGEFRSAGLEGWLGARSSGASGKCVPALRKAGQSD